MIQKDGLSNAYVQYVNHSPQGCPGDGLSNIFSMRKNKNTELWRTCKPWTGKSMSLIPGGPCSCSKQQNFIRRLLFSNTKDIATTRKQIYFGCQCPIKKKDLIDKFQISGNLQTNEHDLIILNTEKQVLIIPLVVGGYTSIDTQNLFFQKVNFIILRNTASESVSET